MIHNTLKINLGELKSLARFGKVGIIDGYRRYKYFYSQRRSKKIANRGYLIRVQHSIEKSLAIRPFKSLSSLQNVKILLDAIDEHHIQNDNLQLSIIATLREYHELHSGLEYEQQEKAVEILSRLARLFESPHYNKLKPQGTKSYSTSPIPINEFAQFKASRSSCRDFSSQTIPEAKVHELLAISMIKPSACNRHSNNFIVVQEKKNIEKLLQIQNGNKTFRDKIRNLLIVTIDLQDFEDTVERNLPFIEGGIAIQSICDTFHAGGLGACVLNWCVTERTDRKLHEILQLNDNYVVIAMIAFGFPDQQQLVPFSEKRYISCEKR